MLPRFQALVGFEDVALQQGVMGDTGQRNAVIGEETRWSAPAFSQHFPTVDRLQPGFQVGQHRLARQLVRYARRGVGERDVAGFTCCHGQRDADNAGRQTGLGCWFPCRVRLVRRRRWRPSQRSKSPTPDGFVAQRGWRCSQVRRAGLSAAFDPGGETLAGKGGRRLACRFDLAQPGAVL